MQDRQSMRNAGGEGEGEGEGNTQGQSLVLVQLSRGQAAGDTSNKTSQACSALNENKARDPGASSTKEGNPSAFHLDACGGQQRPPRPALCSLGRRGPRPGQGGGRLRRRKTRPYRAVATSAPPNPKHVVQFSPLSSFSARPLLPPPFPLAAADPPAAAQEHTPL